MNPTQPPWQTLALADAEIEYLDHGGTGSPVLLVHAGVFGAWLDPLADELAQRGARPILTRRAGYTSGPPPNGPVSIADHASHLAALADHLGLGAVHLVGHSSGSVIALQAAVDHPALVSGLTLGEPPLIRALAATEDLEFLGARVGPAVGAAIGTAAAGDTAAAFGMFMGLVCGPDYPTVLTRTLGLGALARAEAEAGFFFADEILAVDRWEVGPAELDRVTVPVLLVQGGDSPPPVHRLVAQTAARLPHARIASVPGDHLLPLRSPAALADLVMDSIPHGVTARPLLHGAH